MSKQLEPPTTKTTDADSVANGVSSAGANTSDHPFVEFPKIARLTREIVVTEKIDGTNGCVLVHEGPMTVGLDCQVGGGLFVRAGSRSRWISVTDDNFGFAKWVHANAYELAELGVGSHFGEWWGWGIQRGYSQASKRFSLFNTHLWNESRPGCCDVVPVLYAGMMNEAAILDCLTLLENTGSAAAPGFMKPEGVIVYHTAARIYFKKTIHKDSEWKGKAVVEAAVA